MLEYEKISSSLDATGNVLADAGESNVDHRLSNNVFANWIINERLQIVYTNYFQPRINDFKDFRILSRLSVSVPFFSHVEIELSKSMACDRCPPSAADNLDISLDNTLCISIKAF